MNWKTCIWIAISSDMSANLANSRGLGRTDYRYLDFLLKRLYMLVLEACPKNIYIYDLTLPRLQSNDLEALVSN